MANITLHAYVSGRVQGVWFRQSTKEKALSLCLTGWVRNLADGRVEVMAAGEENAVRELDTWLSKGPELANVSDVETEYSSCDETLQVFDVI